MDKKTVLLKKLSSSLARNGAREMTGRSRGIKIREAVEKIFREEREPLLFILDFGGADPSIFPGPTRWWRS